MTLAVIPARGGSKGLPRKNILSLGGRPLIAWTIRAARAARSIDRVIVSTDDDEIADISRAAQAEVPFRRPAELATDTATSVDVVRHVLGHCDAAGYQPATIVLLQPTSPLRTAGDIDAALALLDTTDASAVVSVAPAHPHPFLCKTIGPDGTLTDLVELTVPPTRRQDLPEAYALNGAIYAIRTKAFLEYATFLPPYTVPFIMPAERSVDIDSEFDFRLAEFLLNQTDADAAD